MKKSIIRNIIFGCAMILGSISYSGAAAETKPLSTIRVSIVPIIDTAALHAAIKQGYFAAEGLKIDTTPTAGGAAGLPAVAAGQVQIAFSNVVSTVLGTSQGLGFKMIAPAATAPVEPPEGTAIIALPTSNIKTGKDLENKRVAVNNRSNVIWLYSRAWVEATGGDPDKVTYLEVPFPQMLDAVKSGQVDAAVLVDPFLTSGLKSGAVENVGWPFHRVQPELSISQYVATESYIKENPELVDAFVRALQKGIVWMNDNAGTPEWSELISSFTRLPAETLKTLHVAPFKTTIDPESVSKTLELMKQHNMLTQPMTLDDVLYSPASAK